jgi:hypothetical protein
MSEPQRQPRDIVVEQESAEVERDLEAQSEPEDDGDAGA